MKSAVVIRKRMKTATENSLKEGALRRFRATNMAMPLWDGWVEGDCFVPSRGRAD
jgi:hypothetical protein